jgi:hypothetical protein
VSTPAFVPSPVAAAATKMIDAAIDHCSNLQDGYAALFLAGAILAVENNAEEQEVIDFVRRMYAGARGAKQRAGG